MDSHYVAAVDGKVVVLASPIAVDDMMVVVLVVFLIVQHCCTVVAAVDDAGVLFLLTRYGTDIVVGTAAGAAADKGL